ncbi:MAG: hypothetical protein K2H43_01650, partial [Clostridia bacterium]|nr:hypothetical protein [Clostridia bacterium]
MKKQLFALAAGAVLLLSCGFAGCSRSPDPDRDPTDDPEKPSQTVVTDEESLNYVYEKLYPKNALADEANGFSDRADVKGARFLINGEYAQAFTSHTIRQDIKLVLLNGDKARFVNASAGMAFTLPTQDYTVDYSIAKYRTQIAFGDSVLSVSMNSDNPYVMNSGPWYVYNSEWLIRHLNNEAYYNNCGLKLLNGTHVYDFTETNPYGDQDVKEGYDVYRYDVLIEDGDEIDLPYYNIAIVRKANDFKSFGLFVMKSKTDRADIMNAIIQS